MIAESRNATGSKLRLLASVPLTVVLIVVCLVAVRDLYDQGLASYVFSYTRSEGRLEAAVGLDPAIAAHSKAIGDRALHSVIPPQPHVARDHYRNALLISPYDAIHWLDWALVNEALGENVVAADSLLVACRLAPNLAQAHKEYGDLMLAQGDIDAAIESHSKAIELEPIHARPLYSLYWGLGIGPLEVAQRLLEPDPALLRQYLLDSMTWVEADQMRALWTELDSWSDGACDADAYRAYFDYLIVRREYAAAQDAWADIVQRFYGMDRVEAGKPFWNDQLDVSVNQFQGGLEWRIPERIPKGVRAAISKASGADNKPSLWLHFDGKENVSFSHIRHYLFLKPGRQYRLACRGTSLNITTDNGPLLHLKLVGETAATYFESEPLTGTGQRTLEILFPTPVDVWLAQLTILRRPSKKMNNMIGGDAWFTDFVLEELTPGTDEAGEKQ